jgi:hypothetical protein
MRGRLVMHARETIQWLFHTTHFSTSRLMRSCCMCALCVVCTRVQANKIECRNLMPRGVHQNRVRHCCTPHAHQAAERMSLKRTPLLQHQLPSLSKSEATQCCYSTHSTTSGSCTTGIDSPMACRLNTLPSRHPPIHSWYCHRWWVSDRPGGVLRNLLRISES